MASVTVFVDDAARGELPPVCVQTGAPAEVGVPTDAWVGSGLGLLWLLVLAGPLGWLILLVLAANHAGREKLTVLLPYSAEVVANRGRLRFVRDVSFSLALLFMIGSLLGFLGVPAIWVVMAGVCLGASLVIHARLDWQSVMVTLDASRRWVRLSHVHRAFAEAVERSLPADHRLPAS